MERGGFGFSNGMRKFEIFLLILFNLFYIDIQV